MKIAVTYENERVFQHFGHAEKFKLYEVNENKIINTKIIDSNGVGHGSICNLLVKNNVNILICGGLGSGAKNLLNENNIKIYAGVSGNADEKVNDFLNGKLEFNNEIKCTHHNHPEHNCNDQDCSINKGGCSGNK